MGKCYPLRKYFKSLIEDFTEESAKYPNLSNTDLVQIIEHEYS